MPTNATRYVRDCPYCGKSGARVPVEWRNAAKLVIFAHRRCIGPAAKEQKQKTYDAMRQRIANQ